VGFYCRWLNDEIDLLANAEELAAEDICATQVIEQERERKAEQRARLGSAGSAGRPAAAASESNDIMPHTPQKKAAPPAVRLTKYNMQEAMEALYAQRSTKEDLDEGDRSLCRSISKQYGLRESDLRAAVNSLPAGLENSAARMTQSTVMPAAENKAEAELILKGRQSKPINRDPLPTDGEAALKKRRQDTSHGAWGTAGEFISQGDEGLELRLTKVNAAAAAKQRKEDSSRAKYEEACKAAGALEEAIAGGKTIPQLKNDELKALIVGRGGKVPTAARSASTRSRSTCGKPWRRCRR
jgi:hypothetical protein